MLVEAGKPVVTGSTGFQWPQNFEEILQEKKLSWIHATNFSLGIVIIKQLIQRLNQVDHLLSNKNYTLHEVHHTKKLDAPSGTALSIKEWLKSPCKITSERTGDVIGLHTLNLDTPGEIIRIEHEAKSRALFAEGALWAASYITKNKIEPGLHSFQKVVEKHLDL
jgi:4-hydroxy-tetrahydrodipicolinate reductase